MAEAAKNIDWDKVKSFAGLMTNDIGAAMQGALTYIGDRLGIFKSLASAPATVAGLAERTNLNERYLREWLGAMTAARYVDYDPATTRYSISPEHAMILADETSQFYMGGFMQMIVPEVAMAPKADGVLPHWPRPPPKRISAGGLRGHRARLRPHLSPSTPAQMDSLDARS